MKIKGIDTKANLSKSEEIKIIEALRDAFKGTGNYLEGLFSENLVEYVSRHIRDDEIPDIHEFAQRQLDAVVEDHRQIVNLKSDLRAMRQNFENEAGLRTLNCKERDEEIGRLNEEIGRLNEEIGRLKKELDEQYVAARRALDRARRRAWQYRQELDKVKLALRDFPAED